MTPTVVTLTPRDAGLFGEALALVDRTQGVGIFREDYFPACAASEECTIVAVLVDGALVGVATARVLQPGATSYYEPFGAEAVDLIRRHRTGSLETMSVRETEQGQGVGQRLTHARLAWLASKDCEVVIGVSWASGREHTSDRVFQKLGFRSLGTVPEFYVEDSVRRGFVCPVCGPPPCRCAGTLYVRGGFPDGERGPA